VSQGAVERMSRPCSSSERRAEEDRKLNAENSYGGSVAGATRGGDDAAPKSD
jgi:hypothetical protein